MTEKWMHREPAKKNKSHGKAVPATTTTILATATTTIITMTKNPQNGRPHTHTHNKQDDTDKILYITTRQMTAEQNGFFVINIFAIFYLNISISAVITIQIIRAIPKSCGKKIAHAVRFGRMLSISENEIVIEIEKQIKRMENHTHARPLDTEQMESYESEEGVRADSDRKTLRSVISNNEQCFGQTIAISTPGIYRNNQILE